MATLTFSAGLLLNPVDGVPRAVERRRWVLPLLGFVLCSVLAAASFAVRWEAAPSVYAELAEAGDLNKVAEREVAEKIQTAERVKLVSGVAKAVFFSPLWVLGIACVLKLTGWLLGKKVLFARAFTAAALATVPLSIGRALFALAAWRQSSLTDAQLGTLLPSSLQVLRPQAGPALAAALGAVDFFSLWSVLLLGLGFAEASGLSRRKGLGTAGVLYLLAIGLFQIGLPAMMGGGQ